MLLDLAPACGCQAIVARYDGASRSPDGGLMVRREVGRGLGNSKDASPNSAFAIIPDWTVETVNDSRFQPRGRAAKAPYAVIEIGTKGVKGFIFDLGDQIESCVAVCA